MPFPPYWPFDFWAEVASGIQSVRSGPSRSLRARGQLVKEWIDRIIQRNGIWTVYTRADPRFRCRECFDLDERARLLCKECFGTGYRVTLERWLIYTSLGLRRSVMADVPRTRAGWSVENNPVVWCREHQVPRAGDLILVCEWDKPRSEVGFSGLPTRVSKALVVSFVDPQIDGQVVFYIAHCSYFTESVAVLDRALVGRPISVTRG